MESMQVDVRSLPTKEAVVGMDWETAVAAAAAAATESSTVMEGVAHVDMKEDRAMMEGVAPGYEAPPLEIVRVKAPPVHEVVAVSDRMAWAQPVNTDGAPFTGLHYMYLSPLAPEKYGWVYTDIKLKSLIITAAAYEDKALFFLAFNGDVYCIRLLDHTPAATGGKPVMAVSDCWRMNDFDVVSSGTSIMGSIHNVVIVPLGPDSCYIQYTCNFYGDKEPPGTKRKSFPFVAEFNFSRRPKGYENDLPPRRRKTCVTLESVFPVKFFPAIDPKTHDIVFYHDDIKPPCESIVEYRKAKDLLEGSKTSLVLGPCKFHEPRSLVSVPMQGFYWFESPSMGPILVTVYRPRLRIKPVRLVPSDQPDPKRRPPEYFDNYVSVEQVGVVDILFDPELDMLFALTSVFSVVPIPLGPLAPGVVQTKDAKIYTYAQVGNCDVVRVANFAPGALIKLSQDRKYLICLGKPDALYLIPVIEGLPKLKWVASHQSPVSAASATDMEVTSKQG